MKTLSLPFTVLLLFMMIAGCTSVKRFKTADYKGEDNSLVDMELFGAVLEQPGQDPLVKNLWDLSAGAQTQLIQILNDRYPDNLQFTGALNFEYIMDASGPVIDFTSRNLRMVFTISKRKDYAVIGEKRSRFSPADRIESLKFRLEIPEQYNLSFTGWNRYTTEYGDVEIADVSFSRSIDLNGEVSTEYVDGGFKSTSGRREDQSIRSRYLKLNGSISPKRMEMEAEGTREIDLAGNVVADVSLAFEGLPERITVPVYGAGDGDSPMQLIQLRFVDVRVPRIPEIPDQIMATLEMEYIYRHVQSGWKSYPEWDDRVAYYSGKISKQIPLFTRGEYLPLFYCLGTDHGERETVRIRTSSGVDYPLQFMDQGEAGRFMEWLLYVSSMPGARDRLPLPEIGNYTLLLGDQPLTPEMVSSMRYLKVMPVY